MPRGPVILIAIVLLLIVGIVFLSRSASEQPVKTIETDVTSDGAAGNGATN